MYIYLFICYLVFFILFFSRKIKNEEVKSSNKIFLSNYLIFFSFVIFFLFAALRKNVGTDYIEYVILFKNIINDEKLSFSTNIEPIFVILCEIIGFFSNNPVWIFIITSFIIYYFLFKTILKECKFYELGIFLFIAFNFYTSSLNIVRQWMAITIVLYSYTFLKEGNKNKFLKYVILAICCHYTAIIVLLFSKLIFKINDEKTRIIIIFLGVLFYLNTNFIVNILQSLCLKIPIFIKYYKYLSLNENIGGNVLVLPMFCIITYVLYLYQKRNKDLKIYINILCLGFFVSIIGQRMLIFNRLQYYFVAILVIVIPKIIMMMNEKDKKISYFICFLLGSLFYIYSLNKNGGEPIPYQTIFSNI